MSFLLSKLVKVLVSDFDQPTGMMTMTTAQALSYNSSTAAVVIVVVIF